MALVLHIISALISIAAVFLVIDGLITRRRVLARIANRGRSDDAKEVATHAVAEVHTRFAEHEYGRPAQVEQLWQKAFEQQLSLAQEEAQYEFGLTSQRFPDPTYPHVSDFVVMPVYSGSRDSKLFPHYIAAAGYDVQDDSKLTSWTDEKPIWPDACRFVLFPVAVAGEFSGTDAAPVYRKSRYHKADLGHYVQKVPNKPPRLPKVMKAAGSLEQ